MTRIFASLVFLFALYFGCQIGFNYISTGHLKKYEINDGNYLIEINEHFRSKLPNDNDNYEMSFNVYGDEFNFLIYEDFKKTSNIVVDAKYYIDTEYSCLFVKYKDNKILSDVVCKKEGIYYPINNIPELSTGLETFLISLSGNGYDMKQYIENRDESYTVNNIQVAKSNFDDTHIIGLSIDKYFYRIMLNGKNEFQKLYTGDVENIIQYYFDDYYIIADHSTSPIRNFFVYKVDTGTKETIAVNNLSPNSYFIGHRFSSVYVYDPDNHIEYEINLSKNTIEEIGSANSVIKYFKNGSWETTSYDDFEVNKIKFDSIYKADISDPSFERIYKNGQEYGFYYMVEKDEDGYKVYRSFITNKDKLTYLFKTDDPDSLRFIQDTIYYKKGSTIKCYSDKKGNRTILTDNIIDSYEFDYNVILKKKQEN